MLRHIFAVTFTLYQHPLQTILKSLTSECPETLGELGSDELAVSAPTDFAFLASLVTVRIFPLLPLQINELL